MESVPVDEGVLVDKEESVDLVTHFDGSEYALVTSVRVGGEEGEVPTLDAGVVLHILVNYGVRLT